MGGLLRLSNIGLGERKAHKANYITELPLSQAGFAILEKNRPECWLPAGE